MNATPGPWIVNRHNLRFEGGVLNDAITVERVVENKTSLLDDVYVIAICGQYGTKNEAEAIANAALISIAPDMLEALIMIHQTALTALDDDLNGTISAREVSGMISDIFEKLVNEAGL